MILYHCNFGFPLVSENSQLKMESNNTEGRDENSATGIDQWDKFQAPTAGYTEQVFMHDLKADSDGMVNVELENPDLGLSVRLAYKKSQLPTLYQWKIYRPRRKKEPQIQRKKGNRRKANNPKRPPNNIRTARFATVAEQRLPGVSVGANSPVPRRNPTRECRAKYLVRTRIVKKRFVVKIREFAAYHGGNARHTKSQRSTTNLHLRIQYICLKVLG